MAGWSDTYDDATDIADWHAAAKLVEFHQAIDERRAIIPTAGPSGLETVAANMVGDDVQAASYWKSLQEYVEGLVNGVVSWVKPDASTYEDKTTVETWTFADLMSEVHGGSDWRRKTTPGPAWAAEGNCQAGDIIGPWLFEDLQKALNLLIWTIQSGGSWDDPTPTNNEQSGSEADEATWGAAKSGAEANETSASVDDSPTSWTYGYRGAADLYGASFKTREGTYTVSSIDTTVNHETSFLVKATTTSVGAGTKTFHAHGSGVINGKWHVWDTIAVNNNASNTSDTLGTNDLTPIANWVSQPAALSDRVNGWEVDSVSAILKWNVTGGFTYH